MQQTIDSRKEKSFNQSKVKMPVVNRIFKKHLPSLGNTFGQFLSRIISC